MDKAAVIKAIVDAIEGEFDTLRRTSRATRAAGNDEESKSEGKYDTRSTEDNYLADGLARQAHTAAQAGVAWKDFAPPAFAPDARIDLGALVLLGFPDEERWFFLGPAGGGVEVVCDGIPIITLTPESPLGRQLLGLKVGAATASPRAMVRAVE
jgi:hypothetical protein